MGDYIKLASGEAGRVVDMNWRNTTIRTATGNMIIVPEPLVRYDQLGEYGIRFQVVLRIRNILDEATLKHQFIKRIFNRYREENIQLLVRHD